MKRQIAEDQMRARLAGGELLRSIRESAPAGVRIQTDAELDATLRSVLLEHGAGEDVHVFGYGSLMWNPGLDVVEARIARVNGWHRKFCLRLVIGRGTPQQPGAMLALDRGGACNGVLYRIAAGNVEAELRLLWRREMLAGPYHGTNTPTQVNVYSGGVDYLALPDLDVNVGLY